MPRIVEHMSVEELGARYRGAQDATEARHTQAIWLLAQGRGVLEVADVLAFAPRWVEQLAARYNTLGPGALGDQRRRNLAVECRARIGAHRRSELAAGSVGGRCARWLLVCAGVRRRPPTTAPKWHPK